MRIDTEYDKDEPSLDFVEVGSAVDSSAGVLGSIVVDAEEMRTVIQKVKCRKKQPAMSGVVIGAVVGATDEVAMIDVDSI